MQKQMRSFSLLGLNKYRGWLIDELPFLFFCQATMSRAFCIPGIFFLTCALVLSFLASLSLPFLPALDIVRVKFGTNSTGAASAGSLPVVTELRVSSLARYTILMGPLLIFSPSLASGKRDSLLPILAEFKPLCRAPCEYDLKGARTCADKRQCTSI